MRRFNIERALTCAAAIFVLASVSGCSSGSGIVGEGQPVSVSGVLLNLDTFELVPNAKVYVLDNEATYSATTDANGQWSMTVPSGTLYQFVTDDADNAAENLF